jgi:2-methylcitrate dehydratase PrpD
MNQKSPEHVDAAVKLADNVARIQFNDLPAEVIAHTKRTILDVLSVGVAGTTANGSDILVVLAEDLGGKEECKIFCSARKVPAGTAAMVNSAMARARDYMDEHYELSTCSAVTVVPTALAVAEQVGKVDGRTLITAVALGMDVMIRMAGAWKEKSSGWSLPAVLGYFGAAATAGKLLGLDAAQLSNAFGIAHAQSSGNHQSAIDGALTKRLSSGLAAQGGVLAAMLAQRGWTGERNSFEGRFGFVNLYANGKYDPVPLTRDLGRRFEGVGIGMKAYPSCAHTHTAIPGILELMSRHAIRVENIEKIDVGVNAFNYMIAGEPIEVKRVPKSMTTAQFSIPYTVAAAVLDGKVVIDSFTEDMIRRPDILKLTSRIHVYVDDAIERACSGQAGSARVIVTMTDGSVHEVMIEHAPGSPNNPMSAAQVSEKVWECMRHAAKPVSDATVQEFIDLVNSLEQVDDVAKIMCLLG